MFKNGWQFREGGASSLIFNMSPTRAHTFQGCSFEKMANLHF